MRSNIPNGTPFSNEALNLIFKTPQGEPDKVASRENSSLEFKESFGWNSLAKYLKSCAAFANNKGGYIIYGIKDKPHIMIGLTEKSLSIFEAIDPEKLTSHFNEHFAPEIQWEIDRHELNGLKFGLIYIHESNKKPVLCCKSSGDELKEGDIYYRYRGRSQRIKYPELRSILESNRENEQKLWMKHLQKISQIGVQDCGIFDLKSGHISGTTGSFLIDESLVSQLKFIKEGEFSEVYGEPTLKLIGHLEPIHTTNISTINKQIIRTKGIRTANIILEFLNQEFIEEPLEYIQQICFESTAYLPVYYFIEKSGLSIENIVENIKNTHSRTQAKIKLIDRLENAKTLALEFPVGNTASGKNKRNFIEQLCSKQISTPLNTNHFKHLLQAIRCLTIEQVKNNSPYIRELLREWFNQYYSSSDPSLVNELRRSICWVDECLHKEH